MDKAREEKRPGADKLHKKSHQSDLHITQVEAQALVNEHAGTGTPKYKDVSTWKSQEIYDAGRKVGVF